MRVVVVVVCVMVMNVLMCVSVCCGWFEVMSVVVMWLMGWSLMMVLLVVCGACDSRA